MIETERLRIRRLTEADTEFCLSIWLDEEMGKYLVDPPRDKASDSYLNFAQGIQNQSAWFPFVIVDKIDDTPIGTMSYVVNDDGWDFGYTIHRKYWRQGFAKEALSAMLTYGKSMGIQCFTANVAQENVGSNALLKSLGFEVISTGSFKKSQTDIWYQQFTYRLCI